MSEDKQICVNGKDYARKELNTHRNKDLIIEILVRIAELKEHCKVQDKANNDRFKLHEWLLASIIFTLIGILLKVLI